MTDAEHEQQLAEAFAGLVDQKAPHTAHPELREDLAALAEIDQVIDAAALPVRLSGHAILMEIGAGGMGRVLLAVDNALGRKVAIKTLSERYASDAVLRARFMGEARSMARVSHPNIARIYSLGPAGEPPHFVMEYIDGVPLTRATGHLTFEQRAELMHKVVLGVQFLHEQGILHRDLKPANILVGTDLEPKLVDFGLALDTGMRERLSRAGEVVGTPEYLSPEQTLATGALDVRCDVFSLGAVLYEVLTGELPFRSDDLNDLLRRIREDDPALPRRLNPAIPRDLQNICLKALEKDPSERYSSAREMADDLRRFLAQEPVLADPGAYTRLISSKVRDHLRDLDSWRHDQIVSVEEHNGIRKRYEKLLEREDAWILAARRLTLPQVSLYLGAWVLVVGAALLMVFPYPALKGALEVMLGWAAVIPVAWIGIRTWRRGHYRVAIAYLLAFCLLTPVAALVTFEETRLFTAFTQGNVKLELFERVGFAKQFTNAQIWWALLAGLPVCWWLRRLTRAPVFSLMNAFTAALLCLTTLLRLGVLDCLDHDPGRFYRDLLPCAALFMAAGFSFERLNMPDDSRYFYPFGMAFTFAALSGLAGYHEPWANRLKATLPWTRGQVEYLFILNAVIYFLLDRICDRFQFWQVRMVGKSFRFAIPGHVMTPLFILSFSAETPREAHTLEWILPATACIFVFASIPRQMKNFLVSGLVFLAIGVYHVQQDIYPNRAFWPAGLLVCGLALMTTASNYAWIRVALRRLKRK